MSDRLEQMMSRLNSGREYRQIRASMELRSEGDDGEEMTVEGYATTFNQPYVLWEEDGYVVREQVDPHAFDDCDMTDVIMQYDHNGRVFARTRNNTLTLNTDQHGLKIRAALGGTELGRQLYEEIKGGYTDRMSFGFRVGRDRREVTVDHTNNVTYVLRTIETFAKLYDVSAVSLPANDATEISARSVADGLIDALKEQERLEADKRQKSETLRGEIRRLLAK